MPKDIPLKERIILALDLDTPEQAKELVKKTESRLGFYKVGLQLFMADWFNIVDWLADRGHKVMLDLKFFDIPETVKRAVARVRGHGVHFLTIHGNDPIIRAANEEKGEVKLLAVTVLTSFGEEDLRSMGMSGTIEELVFFRARRALELGCDGVVSSGLEAERLRTGLGDRLILVTPGIRPGANVLSAADDQQRVMTAGNAVRNGADHLVVGRPIARAEDPLAVIESMQEDIAASLTGV
jgi:orotidine-5'-phosphate decarboxylase